MKQKKSLILLTSIIIFSGVTQAALFDRGKGMIYDDQLNITWLQDANYAKTSGYAAENLVENHEGDPIIISEDGRMSWTSANQWADNLVYEGYDDWRLPTLRTDLNLPTTGTNTYQSETIYFPGHIVYLPHPPWIGDSTPELAIGHYTVDDLNNELSFMYFENLGNTSGLGEVFGAHGFHKTENLCSYLCFTNSDPFINVDNVQRGFWTNLPSGNHGGELFAFGYGEIAADSRHNTYQAWAVRPGDVAAIPISSTILLFGSGLMGLIGLTRKKCNRSPTP